MSHHDLLLGPNAPTTGALLAFPRRPAASGAFSTPMSEAELRNLGDIDAPICDADRLLAAAEIRRLRALVLQLGGNPT